MDVKGLKRLLGCLWRGGLVGAGYVGLLFVVSTILATLGAVIPAGGDSSDLISWLFLSGILIGLTLGPIAANMTATFWRHTFVWCCLLFFNSVSSVMEGAVFAPELISFESIPFLGVQQWLTSIGTAVLITGLFAHRSVKEVKTEVKVRPWYSWALRFAISVLTYVILFFVVGGLNYELVTKPFYEQLGLVTPDPQVVLLVETFRGILIVLSVLPFIRTLQTTMFRLSLLSGLTLFIVGGGVPLMLQVNTLPTFLLIASVWEIFLQLFPTGIVAAVLLGLWRNQRSLFNHTPPRKVEHPRRGIAGSSTVNPAGGGNRYQGNRFGNREKYD